MVEKMDMDLNDIIKKNEDEKNEKAKFVLKKTYNQKQEYKKNSNYDNKNFKSKNSNKNNDYFKSNNRHMSNRLNNRLNRNNRYNNKFDTKSNEEDINDSKNNAKDGTLIKVSNLHVSINNDDLRKLFTKYGTMIKCHVIFNEMGYSTKIAKVQYKDKKSAENAIEELNEAEIENESIKLETVSSRDFNYDSNRNYNFTKSNQYKQRRMYN